MNSFSFKSLTDATPLTITSTLQQHVQSVGEESFPDDKGVGFTITQTMQAGGMNYVEVTPDQDIGDEKYVFELNADMNIGRCYALEDEQYDLLFD